MAVTFTNYLSGNVPTWVTTFAANTQTLMNRETANLDKSHFIDVVFDSTTATYRVFIVLENAATFNFFDAASQTLSPANNITPVVRWGAVSIWSRSGGQVAQAIRPWDAANSIGIQGTTYGIHVIDGNIRFTFNEINLGSTDFVNEWGTRKDKKEFNKTFKLLNSFIRKLIRKVGS